MNFLNIEQPGNINHRELKKNLSWSERSWLFIIAGEVKNIILISAIRFPPWKLQIANLLADHRLVINFFRHIIKGFMKGYNHFAWYEWNLLLVYNLTYICSLHRRISPYNYKFRFSNRKRHFRNSFRCPDKVYLEMFEEKTVNVIAHIFITYKEW